MRMLCGYLSHLFFDKKSVKESYEDKQNIRLRNSKVIYNVTLLKIKRISLKEEVPMENWSLVPIHLYFETTFFVTVSALDNNYTWHPSFSDSKKKQIEMFKKR